MVNFVSIFWYNLNGFLNVENVRQFNFFPAKKAPDDSRGVVRGPSLFLFCPPGSRAGQVFLEIYFLNGCPAMIDLPPTELNIDLLPRPKSPSNPPFG